MSLRNLIRMVCLAVVFATAGQVQAGFIVGAVSVSASLPDYGGDYEITNLINQSGISATYTSGVSDFDAFLASAALSLNPSSPNSGGWASTSNNALPVDIDFNLGAVKNITRLALWNDTDSQALGNFQVFASADGSFTSLTSLGSFSGTPQSVGTLAQIFNTTDANTQYIRVRGQPFDFQESGGLLNIGEFAFEANAVSEPNAVPEPATVALWGIGALGMGLVARRRAKKVAAV